MLVILYVHDSLRYDFVGCFNPNELNTPSLDALAKEGVRFTNAFAQSTWTKASAASILTSLYPQALAAQRRKAKVPSGSFTLLNGLRQHGYMTLGLSANSFFSGMFGFQDGFDLIPDLFALEEFQSRPRRGPHKKRPGNRKAGNPFISSADLNKLLIANLPESAGPVLAVLWSNDTHIPLFDRDRIDEYDSGLPVISLRDMPNSDPEEMLDLYRGMIQFADRHFGELIETLRARGLYDESLIVVLGDHGESFGEHGQIAHAGKPYDEQIHVPLVIKFPRASYAGRSFHEPVELVDIMPTVSELAGIRLDEAFVSGHSLIPILEGLSRPRDYAYSAVGHSESSSGTVSLRGANWHYMRRVPPSSRAKIRIGGFRLFAIWIYSKFLRPIREFGSSEMYFDLIEDPEESRNLAGLPAFQKKVRKLRQETILIGEKNLALQKRWGSSRPEAELDQRVRDRLAALGYDEE